MLTTGKQRREACYWLPPAHNSVSEQGDETTGGAEVNSCMCLLSCTVIHATVSWSHPALQLVWLKSVNNPQRHWDQVKQDHWWGNIDLLVDSSPKTYSVKSCLSFLIGALHWSSQQLWRDVGGSLSSPSNKARYMNFRLNASNSLVKTFPLRSLNCR